MLGETTETVREQTGWRSIPLGETGKYINGLAFKPTDWGDEGLPIVRIQNLTDPTKPLNRTTRVVDPAYVVNPGDILVSWSATLDAFIWNREQGLLNQHIFKVVPDTRVVTKKFLFYTLKKAIAEMVKSEHLHGSTMKHINRGPFLAHRVDVPSLETQEIVVAEIEKQFSRLDEAVANLQRVKANLKRYKESVYTEVFGDVPNCTLGDLIEEGPQNGLYLPKQMYGEGVPILRIDDYQTGWIRPVEELRRVKATQDQVSTWSLLEGDLVINRVNSMTHLGKCALVPKALAGAVFESNMMRVRLKDGVLPRYVEHYLASKIGKKRLTGNAKWAVNQASINQKDVRATQIFLPDTATQVQTVAEVDQRLSIVREVEAEVDANLRRAQALRQATLSKAFSTH
jgi:type I restriction enzyme S subunit